MAVRSLDVGLRGTRDYIQGSQILARTGELIRADAPGPVLLVSAKFTRITEQGVIAVLDEDGPIDGEEIGQAQYDDGGTRRVARFLAAPGPPAPRIDDVPKVTSDLAVTPEGSAACAFAIAGTFESYLVAVIEFVKAVHAARGDGVADIWFTALMGARLPLEAIYPASGVLRYDPKVERLVGDRTQTLGLLATEGEGAPPPFQLCFSCVIPT